MDLQTKLGFRGKPGAGTLVIYDVEEGLMRLQVSDTSPPDFYLYKWGIRMEECFHLPRDLRCGVSREAQLYDPHMRQGELKDRRFEFELLVKGLIAPLLGLEAELVESSSDKQLIFRLEEPTPP